MAYIALGSNLGNREETLRAALETINRLPNTRVAAASTFIETAPVDAPAGSGPFMNAAAALDTQLPPPDLMHALLKIECSLGRDRSTTQLKNSPRPIDLDLLLYGSLVHATPELTLPHPRMHLRRFVLEPLAQIAPDLPHPVSGKTIRQLLSSLTGVS